MPTEIEWIGEDQRFHYVAQLPAVDLPRWRACGGEGFGRQGRCQQQIEFFEDALEPFVELRAQTVGRAVVAPGSLCRALDVLQESAAVFLAMVFEVAAQACQGLPGPNQAPCIQCLDNR